MYQNGQLSNAKTALPSNNSTELSNQLSRLTGTTDRLMEALQSHFEKLRPLRVERSIPGCGEQVAPTPVSSAVVGNIRTNVDKLEAAIQAIQLIGGELEL